MTDRNRDKTISAPAVAVLAVDIAFHDKIPELSPSRPEMRETFVDDAEKREQVAGQRVRCKRLLHHRGPLPD